MEPVVARGSRSWTAVEIQHDESRIGAEAEDAARDEARRDGDDYPRRESEQQSSHMTSSLSVLPQMGLFQLIQPKVSPRKARRRRRLCGAMENIAVDAEVVPG
jgi:hypothetical protein